VLIKTDFHHVIQLVCSPSGDDHTSIGGEAADIKRNNPAQNIDFADEEFAVVVLRRHFDSGRIGKSEPEARKHLLDRSAPSHGGFEDAERASEQPIFAVRSGGRYVEPRG
jgi:hypothetical protein